MHHSNQNHSYILIKFVQNADRIKQFIEFENHLIIKSCLATIGCYDLFLQLITSSSKDASNFIETKIKNNSAISSFTHITLKNSNNNSILSSLLKDDYLYTLALVELDSLQTSSLEDMNLQNNILVNHSTAGKFQAILLLQGSNFNENHQYILENIWPLSGMNRIKNLDVIDLF